MNNRLLPMTKLETIIYREIYSRGIPKNIYINDGNYFVDTDMIATIAPSISGSHIIIELLDVISDQYTHYKTTNDVKSIDIKCRDPFEEIEALYQHILLHSNLNKKPCEQKLHLRCSDCHLRTEKEKCFNTGDFT